MNRIRKNIINSAVRDMILIDTGIDGIIRKMFKRGRGMRRLSFTIYLIFIMSILMVPALAYAEETEDRPVTKLVLGKSKEGMLTNGKTSLYEFEPSVSGYLTITIRSYVKDELHSKLYPADGEDSIYKAELYDENKGYSMIEYKVYVGPRKYRLEISNPIIINSGSYRIDTKFTKKKTFDTGFNTNPSSAAVIKNNTFYSGVLAFDETEDYYSISFKKSTQFKLKITGNEQIMLKVTIKDSKGGVIDRGQFYSGSTIYNLDKLLSAGKYSIVISAEGYEDFQGATYKLETGTYIPITSISIPSEKTFQLGDTYSFQATLKPSKATGLYYYTSSDPDSVRVTEDGKLTAMKKGTAKITVRTFDGEISDTCNVTVKDNPVTKLTLNTSKVSLHVGDTYTLKATIAPKNATKNTVIWISSNKKVATVNTSGKVTAKGTGTCKITARTGDKTAKVTITVTKKPVATPTPSPKPKPTTTPTPAPTPEQEIVSVDSISIPEALELKVGEAKVLNVTITPENATDRSVVWTSTDYSVVTVENGTITCRKAGKATIVVTASNGKRAFCNITVY